MEQKQIVGALKSIRQQKKRKFTQTVDLVINLKGLDLKKPTDQVDFYAAVHYTTGRKKRIAAFVGPEMRDGVKGLVETVITTDDFGRYKDKKLAKRLASGHDYFIAQANIMAQVAAAFGKVLGPRGKMPNPKAGCVFPPKASLKPLCDRLQLTVRVKARALPVVQCVVGREDMKDEEIADNVEAIYKQLVHALPNHENNIGKAMLKLTMGQPVVIA